MFGFGNVYLSTMKNFIISFIIIKMPINAGLKLLSELKFNLCQVSTIYGYTRMQWPLMIAVFSCTGIRIQKPLGIRISICSLHKVLKSAFLCKDDRLVLKRLLP